MPLVLAVYFVYQVTTTLFKTSTKSIVFISILVRVNPSIGRALLYISPQQVHSKSITSVLNVWSCTTNTIVLF